MLLATLIEINVIITSIIKVNKYAEFLVNLYTLSKRLKAVSCNISAKEFIFCEVIIN